MAYIAATAVGFPRNYYPQEELLTLLTQLWSKRSVRYEVLNRFHRNVTVRGRYMALPIEEYKRLDGFQARNTAWIQTALELGEQVLCSVLERARLLPQQIAHLAFTTVTGIAVPSVDARLMNRIPFPASLKRAPLFGLGCVGGAAGIARVADYLKGHPREAAILLSIELCSLTFQGDDLSVENLIATGLFGDGAAAVLLLGDEHPRAKKGQARVVDSQSIFFPSTEHIMGWDVRDTGFKVLLSPDVSEVAQERLRPAVEAFLRPHGLEIEEIGCWIAHPGGPKVIDGIEQGLGLESEALQVSRDTLARVGNLSSASVLLVLQETLAERKPEPGTYGVLMAMGPAFCAELVLLKW
jgi:alkylresorcinol/alkylpyrone synthase